MLRKGSFSHQVLLLRVMQQTTYFVLSVPMFCSILLFYWQTNETLFTREGSSMHAEIDNVLAAPI